MVAAWLAACTAGTRVPPELAGIALDREPPAASYGSVVSLWGMTGEIAYVLSDQRTITHVLFWPMHDIRHPGLNLEGRIQEVSDRVSDALGMSPAVIDPSRLFWKESGSGHRLELQQLETSGGGSEVRLVLRTEDPGRVCGERDGFASWLSGLQMAIHSGEAAAVAPFLHFPFLDQAGAVLGVDADERLHFDDAGELAGRWREPRVREWLADLEAAKAEHTVCEPHGYEGVLGGYSIDTRHGPVGVQRRGGAWRALLIYYVP